MSGRLVCGSRAKAIMTLEAIADGMNAGTERAALLAVRDWAIKYEGENRITPERLKMIDDVFSGKFDEETLENTP